MLYHALGRIEVQDGEIFVVTEEGDSGCVLYGPYLLLKPGSYEVEFYIRPADLSGSTCCVIDVLRRGRTITAEKDFTASELIYRNSLVSVRFEVVEADTYEFRLSATGGSALAARYRRPVRLIQPPGS